MSVVFVSPFLRRVLVADALISAAAGVLMGLGAGPLQDVLALPGMLLRAAGLALLPWAACLMWLARRPIVPAGALWAVIIVNLMWVAESAWVAFAGAFQPNALGQAFIVIQAIAVAVIADFEFIGMRRSAPMRSA